MISFACPHCQVRVKVEEEFAGRKGKCLRCGQQVIVPSELATAGGSSATGDGPARSGVLGRPADELHPANGSGQSNVATASPPLPASRVASTGVLAATSRELSLAATREGLESCPDCHKLVSRRALFCPSCGSPVRQRWVGEDQVAPRFGSLKLLLRMYRVGAWLLLAVALLCGTIAALLVMAAVNQERPITEAYESLALTILSFLASIACFAISEGLLVFLSIEENTRATRQALTQSKSA